MKPSCVSRRELLAIVPGIMAVGALAPGRRVHAQETGTVTADEAEALLAQRPLSPRNEELFTPGAYPGTPELTSPGGEPLSERQAFRALRDYVRAEFPDDSDAQEAVLTLFESSDLVAMVEEPSLRASLLGLKGTRLGEVALDFVLNPSDYADADENPLPGVNFFLIGRQDMFADELDGTIALTFRNSESNRLETYLNPALQAESPFLISRHLLGPLLFVDRIDSELEKGIIDCLQNLIYLEQLNRHPELATLGTELSRRNNVNAMARLNSGEGVELGLFRTNGGAPLQPGSDTEFDSFWAIYSESDNLDPTPGNGILTACLELLRESDDGEIPQGFNQETLDWLDENQGLLSPQTLAAAAMILQLEPPSAD